MQNDLKINHSEDKDGNCNIQKGITFINETKSKGKGNKMILLSIKETRKSVTVPAESLSVGCRYKQFLVQLHVILQTNN